MFFLNLFGADELEREKKYVEKGTKIAQFYREKFLQIKLICGNSGVTSSLIAILLRHGLAPRYIDYFGMETSAGQIAMPEKISELTPEATYLIQEIARKFGGRDHSTVIYACTKLEQIMKIDKHIRTVVSELTSRLQEALK